MEIRDLSGIFYGIFYGGCSGKNMIHTGRFQVCNSIQGYRFSYGRTCFVIIRDMYNNSNLISDKFEIRNLLIVK
jgi:hypothetical protein